MRKICFLTTMLGLLVIVNACKTGSATNYQPIRSVKAGEMTVTLASPSGQLRRGENDLTLLFVDASGNAVDVGAASLNFHMGAMGTMAEMNDRASLTTTEKPGQYAAKVNIQMSGTWEAQIAYQGGHGTGQATMNVQVK